MRRFVIAFAASLWLVACGDGATIDEEFGDPDGGDALEGDALEGDAADETSGPDGGADVSADSSGGSDTAVSDSTPAEDAGSGDGAVDGTLQDGASDGSPDATELDSVAPVETGLDGEVLDAPETDGAGGSDANNAPDAAPSKDASGDAFEAAVDAAPLPTITIADASVAEGNAGTKALTFQVTLSQASTTPISVGYITADGSALSGPGDYVPAQGTLTFPANTTTQAITVLVNGDTLFEGNETFTVQLASPVGATVADGTATGTIENDDAQPSLSITDVSGSEGTSTTRSFGYVVSLSAPAGAPVSVKFATGGGTATASDYTAANGTLVFAPGEVTKTIDVTITADSLPEPDETFEVTLTEAVGAGLAKGVGKGTIVNDDAAGPLPTLSVFDAATHEGNSGDKELTFTVRLSFASASPVVVTYATTNQTAQSPTDFTAKTGTLNFNPGVTEQTVTVFLKGDTLTEPDETFTLDLSGAVNATISDASAVGTIQNDDVLPTLSINDKTEAEGDFGSKNFTFTITLSAPSSQQVSVGWKTENGTATGGGALTFGRDYFTASGTVTFNPGETTKTITVSVSGDFSKESNETFKVVLQSPTNATIADGEGLGTITNDD